MAGVLVLDPSATLRYVIGKSLRDKGFDVNLCSDYHVGAQLLRAAEQDGKAPQFKALVMSWPAQDAPGSAALLDLVAGRLRRRLAVVLLSHEPDRRRLEWVRRRGRSALLLLDGFDDISDTLQELMEAPEPAPPARADAPLPGEGIRVLFVDDSATARTFISRLLKANGYQVEAAADPQEALRMAASRAFDIAIIDYFMPAYNGDELCRRLKAQPETAHMMTAIFTSAYLDKVIKDSLNAGASDCMFKNEADELLLARLAAMSRTIRTRRAVEQESRRLEGILSSVGEGVYGVDTSGRITFCNPAAKSILGYGENDNLIGESAHAMFHYANADGTPIYPETCFLQQAYELGDELHGWETAFWKADGVPVTVECTVYPLRIEGHLKGSVAAFRDMSGRKAMEEELKWQINHDHLTKLLNRHFFEEELQREVQRLRHNRRDHSALLYIDLDRFKYINDTAGHSAGDQLLVELSRQLQTRLRRDDLLARLGGDEFAVILRNVRGYDVGELAEAFLGVLQDFSFTYKGKAYKINGSIGVSLVNWQTPSADDALANADIACHIAKQQGRNKVHVYDPGNDDKLAMDIELGWSARLHEALDRNQFLLHFQPILATADLLPGAGMGSGQPVHYEVLVRLPGRSGKLISPDAFLPTAERFNLIQRVDCWVLRHALTRLAEHDRVAPPTRLAVNLSGPSLTDRLTQERIRAILSESAIAPERICFEITETSAIENVEAAQGFIADFKALGCRFALDDFGSGFSSFAHLKHLDVDFIKIDGGFVKEMARSPVDHAIVRSINEIGHALGKKTIAEFVETPEQLRMLYQMGVDMAQGNGLGLPTAKLGERQALMEMEPPGVGAAL